MNRQERHKIGARGIDPAVRATTARTPSGDAVAIDVVTAMLGVRAAEPVVAIVSSSSEDRFPGGNFRPSEHRSLENSARAWIAAQTGAGIEHLQHLHADSIPADIGNGHVGPHTISVSYVALVSPGQCSDRTRATWRSWYDYFPWENWRHGKPACLNHIEQHLLAWTSQPGTHCAASGADDRTRHLRIAFGTGTGWDEEKVLERYLLMHEAGLLGRESSAPAATATKSAFPLRPDHALVLARAMGDLRRRVKYRPVVFELMQDEFTLFELQRVVEAILGPHLHKQNFRRLVESCGLVEPAGDIRLRTGGRPARLYRFRRDVVLERASPGVRLRSGRV